jgi:hypothetical protein
MRAAITAVRLFKYGERGCFSKRFGAGNITAKRAAWLGVICTAGARK